MYSDGIIISHAVNLLLYLERYFLPPISIAGINRVMNAGMAIMIKNKGLSCQNCPWLKVANCTNGMIHFP
jgi:hypothetical protein